MSDFAITAKLYALDGTTLIFDMSDTSAGYDVVDLGPADETRSTVTTTSPFVNGEFEVSSTDGPGKYQLTVAVRGSSWAQVETRRIALRTAYRSASHYLLEVTVQGVVSRYPARRPDVASGPMDPIINRRKLLLTFPVQPNPTVTGV